MIGMIEASGRNSRDTESEVLAVRKPWKVLDEGELEGREVEEEQEGEELEAKVVQEVEEEVI